MPSLKTLIFTVVATELILGGAAHNLRVGLISGLVPAIRANAVRGNEEAAPPKKRFYADLFIEDVMSSSTDTDVAEMLKLAEEEKKEKGEKRNLDAAGMAEGEAK